MASLFGTLMQYVQKRGQSVTSVSASKAGMSKSKVANKVGASSTARGTNKSVYSGSSGSGSSSGGSSSGGSSSSSGSSSSGGTSGFDASAYTINKEACEKYGITLSDIPTEPVEPYSRYEADDTVYGFVTEVSHDQKGTEIEIKDWGYCLEDNTIELGFQDMLRSQIMEEVIKTYGLVPLVDLSGLQDDTISWDNSTSKGNDNGGGGDLTGAGSGSASIDEAVEDAIRGKKNPLDKAKAIDQAFKGHVYYKCYWDCQYANDLDAAWKDAHLNCADGANILSAMFTKGGLKPCIVHVPNHYIVRLNINGKNYYTDNAAAEGLHTSRPFGETWKGMTSGTDVGTHIGG